MIRFLKSPYFLSGLILLAVIINSVIHYNSPVYRYYQDNVRKVNDQYADIRRRIFTDLIPFVQLALTNHHDASVSSVSLSGLSVSTNSVPLDIYLDFNYIVAGGDPILFFGGNSYRLGDLFLGSPLVYISPTLVQSLERRFIHCSLKDSQKDFLKNARSNL